MEKVPKIDPEKTSWELVLLFVGAGVVGAFQVGKASPMLLAIRSELGMSLFLVGWILSLFRVIGFLVGSAAVGVAFSLVLAAPGSAPGFSQRDKGRVITFFSFFHPVHIPNTFCTNAVLWRLTPNRQPLTGFPFLTRK